MALLAYYLIAFVALISAVAGQSSPNATCNSPIYCPGPILDAVQRAKLFNDSKTFVDKPTTKPLAEVLTAFSALSKPYTREALQSFVDANFGPEGTETEAIIPRDWKAAPEFLSNITDPTVREWAQTVHGYWRILTREFKDSTLLCEGCVSSLLPAKQSFVIPGGRFREIYYWDTYFVMLGLAKSEMFDTMSDMIDNFMDYVQQYGFMPNGARIYYLNRSQPPLLTQMVDLYVNTTRNTSQLAEWLPLLDREHDFWLRNRTITVPRNGTSFELNRYAVINSDPRPESYMEDVHTVEGAGLTGDAAAELYANLATGAETGWDFSSRWIENPINDTTQQAANLQRLVTKDVIPVDLNAILFANEVTLQELHARVGNDEESQKYRRMAESRRLAMWSVLYDDKLGEFRDWEMETQMHGEWSSASFWPSWAGVADRDPREKSTSSSSSSSPSAEQCEKMMGQFKVLKTLNKDPGGITSTFYNTGLQWDYPNSWPPQTYIALNAITRTSKMCPNSSLPLTQYAATVAQTYIAQAFCSWRQTGGTLPSLPALSAGSESDQGHVFEKYNVTRIGAEGGGGEYVVQIGFGWTNGVALAILANQPYSAMSVPDCGPQPQSGGQPANGADPATGASQPSAAFGKRSTLPAWICAFTLFVLAFTS
ncbi:trehalase-like protein [Powellomyces hirtus]|nr:trehalase-like protein [Powellomyces hirtus]